MLDPEYISNRYWLKSYRPDLPAQVAIPQVSLPELIEQSMRRNSNRTALVYGGKKISYGELQVYINNFAAALHGWGVRKGDTVGLLLPNCPQFACAYFGALKIGAMVTALSPLFTPPEVEFQLRDSNTRTLVMEEGLWPRIEPAVKTIDLRHIVTVSLQERRRTPIPGPGVFPFDAILSGTHQPPPVPVDPQEDVAILQYTGGTSGLPKAAMLTHRNVVADITQMACFLDIMAATDGVTRPTLVSVLPWYHIYAQTVDLCTTLSRGGTVITLPVFDTDRVLRTIQESRAQMLMGISSIFQAFLNHPRLGEYDLSSLLWCNNGATVISPDVVRAFEDRTGVRIVEGYGLSEASPVTHTTSPYLKRKIGMVGPPIPNTMQAVIAPETGSFLPPGQTGEILVHGPQVMKGYWQKPEETADVFIEINGREWLRTGDIGCLDADGYMKFVDRSKDLIKYKGHSVYSTEVEQVLHLHPAVSQAAVIGVPDLLAGEIIKAFVVLKQGLEKVTEQEIISWARTRLAGYKHPRVIEFRKEFPGTLFGKMLRRVLREEELKKHALRDEEVYA